MHYQSHAWGWGFTVCEIYARLHEGKRPSAGETVWVEDAGSEPFPLSVVESRWQDEEVGGILVLCVGPDQRAGVDKLVIGCSIRRRLPDAGDAVAKPASTAA